MKEIGVSFRSGHIIRRDNPLDPPLDADQADIIARLFRSPRGGEDNRLPIPIQLLEKRRDPWKGLDLFKIFGFKNLTLPSIEPISERRDLLRREETGDQLIPSFSDLLPDRLAGR